ncbi:MAG TPA: hypothetical protein VLA93_05580 [Pyrinomonadaceae bacterium]|nr:hypothetical protein [Pyrinomonadaceae bacterium]
MNTLPKVDQLSIRKEAGPRGISQFLFQEPRLKRDQLRVVRTGLVSKPTQGLSSYAGFVWPFVDQLFREVFELD